MPQESTRGSWTQAPIICSRSPRMGASWGLTSALSIPTCLMRQAARSIYAWTISILFGRMDRQISSPSSSSATSPRRKRRCLHPERQKPQAGTSTVRSFTRWKLPLDRMQPKNRRSRFMTTSGKSSLPAVSLVSKSRSSMKPIPRCGRKSFLRKYAPVRCVCLWAAPSRWALV